MDHVYAKLSKSPRKAGQGSKSKDNTYCCVPQCCNYRKKVSGLSFHYFPKNELLRKAWMVALKMGKPPSNSMRVCSAHFDPKHYFPGDGKKTRRLQDGNVVPTMNLPVGSCDKKVDASRKERDEDRASRRKRRGAISSTSEIPRKKVAEGPTEENDPPDDAPDTLVESDGSAPPIAEGGKEDSLRKDASTQTDPECLKLSGGKERSTVPLMGLLTDKSVLFTFTGIHSFELLDGIVECVSDLVRDSPLKGKELNVKERVVLTFVKLKMSVSFSCLGPWFSVSRHTASRYFRHMIRLLRLVMESVIPWPEVEENRNNMPKCFDAYRATRIVLDCAETPVQHCKCIKCRILTYSHYKKKHTLKFDVGVAPSGLIIEISDCYGGRASDKLIVKKSGILDKLQYGDAVMVDKGFMIEKECLERCLKLYRPPFLKKNKQLSKADALGTAKIAKARVHVERVIQRLRQFEFIREEVEWSLVPYFNDALKVAAGIVNLSAPVLNIDKF